MKNATEMLSFLRGQSSKRLAACPVFTDVFCQVMNGHPWLLDSNDPINIEDILRIGENCGFVPLFEILWFEVGMTGYDQVRDEMNGEYRDRVKTFRTPKGEYRLIDRFQRGRSRHVLQHAFSTAQDLDAYEYIVRRAIDRVEQCRPAFQAVVQQVGDRGLPYFTVPSSHRCLSLFGSEETIYLLMDEPDRMMQLCQLNNQLALAASKIALECGFHLLFAGTESGIYSPDLIHRFALPFLEERRELVHQMGGLFYLHECGKMHNLIESGLYARLSPDILEGFQPPPSGDIPDLAKSISTLPQSIVTKGNLDLNFLRNSSADQVRQKCVELLNKILAIPGRRHLMGGSCSLLPGTPLENIRAMVEAVDQVNES